MTCNFGLYNCQIFPKRRSFRFVRRKITHSTIETDASLAFAASSGGLGVPPYLLYNFSCPSCKFCPICSIFEISGFSGTSNFFLFNVISVDSSAILLLLFLSKILLCSFWKKKKKKKKTIIRQKVYFASVSVKKKKKKKKLVSTPFRGPQNYVLTRTDCTDLITTWNLPAWQALHSITLSSLRGYIHIIGNASYIVREVSEWESLREMEVTSPLSC